MILIMMGFAGIASFKPLMEYRFPFPIPIKGILFFLTPESKPFAFYCV